MEILPSPDIPMPKQVSQSLTASALASFILSQGQNEKLESPLLTFSNYLSYICDSTEVITPELINRFYYRALLFSGWQKNFETLVASTMVVVRTYCERAGTDFSFADTIDASQLEVVALSKPKVAFKVVNKFLESELTPYDQYKLFEERDGRIIAVVKRHDGPLRVFSFPKWAALMDGEAVPLCTDFALAYDSELEFELGVPQHLEISPTTHARFTFTQAPRPLGATSRPQESLLNGVVVRGLNFQPLHILSNTTLLKEAQLFYPVKRLEQFFVDRKSDSVYLELTSNMARAIDMVLKREPHAVAFAQAVLERSRLAIEQIFPDDKTLQIQVQSLESALSIENVWPTAHQNLQIELD